VCHIKPIRAVEEFFESLQAAKLEQSLVEGYTANAEQARQVSEEFARIDPL
jgi:hypothetical protein